MYKRPVKDMMNPFIQMDLDLKESRKYVKQGRTYNSTIKNLEILMWFVYEKNFDRTHRQLGTFAACERELLHTAQELTAPLDKIKIFSQKLLETGEARRKQDILQEVIRAEKSAEDAYYQFWEMREDLSSRSEKVLRDAAETDPGKLKDACEDLKLKDILFAMHDAFHDSAEKLENALQKLESVEQGQVPDRNHQREVYELLYSHRTDAGRCDKEIVLLAALKECMKNVKDRYAGAAKMLKETLGKYERIKDRTAGKDSGEKEKNRESVRKKIAVLQMQQPERTGRVAEEKRKEMMR